MDVGQLLKEYDLLIVLIVWSTKELFPWAKSRLDLATNRNSNRVSTIQSLYERLLSQNERQMTQNGKVSQIIIENTEAYHQVHSAITDNTTAINEMRQVIQRLESTVEHQFTNFRSAPP